MGCLSLLYSPACGRLQINIARARVQNVDGRPLLKIAYSQFYAVLCNPWIYSAMTIRSDPDFDKVHSLKEAQDWECDILGRIYLQKMTNWKDDNQNPSFESFCRRILLLKEGKMPKIGICLKDDTLETTSIGWLKNVKSQNKFLGKSGKAEWEVGGRKKICKSWQAAGEGSKNFSAHWRKVETRRTPRKRIECWESAKI